MSTAILSPLPPVLTEAAPPRRALSSEQAKSLAQEFEGVFVAMLLKQLRRSLSGDGLFPGDEADALGGLFDQQMGAHISQHAGIGLAQSLERYLSRSETT